MSSTLKVYQNANLNKDRKQKSFYETDQEKLLHLFIFIDSMLKFFPFKMKNKCGKNASLSDSELITLALWRYHKGFSDWKHAHSCFASSYIHEFPKIPSYKNFLTGINRIAVKALWILGVLMNIAKKDNSLLKIIDSSGLPVCRNKRIFNHKVMKNFATRGKNSLGWFYGLKLHLVIDVVGNLLSFRLTTGRVDDRFPVKNMFKTLIGVFLADEGYISQKLKKELLSFGKVFITCVKKSMKQLISKENHELLKNRQRVEIALAQIKSRLGMATSLPRSPLGMFAHYIYVLLAYQTFYKVLGY